MIPVFTESLARCLGNVHHFLKNFLSESPPKRWRTSFGPSGQRLQTNAGLYNGLYVGLERVRDKTAKKPKKVLKEWHSRTVYKWEESPIPHGIKMVK